MKKSKKILFDSRSKAQKDYMDLEPLYFRILYYTNRILSSFYIQDIADDEDSEDFYVAQTTFSYRLNAQNTRYVKITEKRGFSFKGGKINFWFKDNLKIYIQNHTDLLTRVLEHKRLEWFIPLLSNQGLAELITKTLLEKIFSRKITNPETFIKFIIKYNIKTKIPHKVVLKYYNGNCVINNFLFKNALRVSTNPEFVVKNINKLIAIPDFQDVVTQCTILNIKYNPKWSQSRFKSFHAKCSLELMKQELHNIEDYKLSYIGNLPIKEISDYKAKLLTTSTQIFEEGYNMHHCVYTNYMSSIKRGEYYVFNLIIDDIPATAGISIVSDFYDKTINVHVDQVRAKRNAYIRTPDKFTNFISYNKDFFINNYKILNNEKT